MVFMGEPLGLFLRSFLSLKNDFHDAVNGMNILEY